MPEQSTLQSHLVYVGLGANLGDRASTVRAAVRELTALATGRGLRVSPFYFTATQEADGPTYLNAVAELRTPLSPHDLLKSLLSIEALHGRERPYPNAPRTLDLDLLLYDAIRLATCSLTVPHPRMHLRAFVLRPLLDLAPDLELAGLGRIDDLLARLPDQSVQLASEELIQRCMSA